MSFPDQRHQPHAEIINATSRSASVRASELSNFSPRPFVLRGTHFANVEAFLQALKYDEASDERAIVATLSAKEAKKKSPTVPPEAVEWEGQAIAYRSHDHYVLQAAGIFAKFDQNEEALELLLATGKLPIEHDLSTSGHQWVESADTCLPAEVFSQILTETREHFFGEMGVQNQQLTGNSAPLYITNELVAYARS